MKFKYGLRIRVFVVHVLGALALWALARTARGTFALGELYLAKVVAVYAVGTVLCLRYVDAHHPFTRYGPANLVTLIRGMFVALIAGLVGEAPVPAALASGAVLAVAIAVLDGFDGRLARRTGLGSAFGARFDMETDSLLVLVLSVLAWQHGKAGIWVLGCGLMRYAFVAAGWALPWLAGPLSPTLRGKTVAVIQMGALSFVLLPLVTPPWSTAVAAAALAVLVWSFALDVGRLWRAR